MIAIRNYNNTLKELNVSKNRLELLLDKKERLYVKYFPLTTKLTNEIKPSESEEKMAMYMNELLTKSDITGMSLEEEIQLQLNEIQRWEYYIKLMDYNLSNLEGIEYKIYYYVIIENMNITKAVQHVAALESKEEKTIWKYHYPKIKKELQKIKKGD